MLNKKHITCRVEPFSGNQREIEEKKEGERATGCMLKNGYQKRPH